MNWRRLRTPVGTKECASTKPLERLANIYGMSSIAYWQSIMFAVDHTNQPVHRPLLLRLLHCPRWRALLLLPPCCSARCPAPSPTLSLRMRARRCHTRCLKPTNQPKNGAPRTIKIQCRQQWRLRSCQHNARTATSYARSSLTCKKRLRQLPRRYGSNFRPVS